MRGDGEAEATRIFARAFGQDQEFFAFWRTMQGYKDIFDGGNTATHGSPHDYDAQVPLILWGAPFQAGRRTESVRVVDLAPTLAELRLHQGTVWLWNRPVYDNLGGGHLRIEMRALPAGPTAVDMVANAAFLIGLAEGLRPHINELLPGLPFPRAEYNFYRAA